MKKIIHTFFSNKKNDYFVLEEKDDETVNRYQKDIDRAN